MSVYMTVKEVAQRFKISETKIRRLIDDGELWGVWFGTRVRILRDSVTEFEGSQGVRTRPGKRDLQVRYEMHKP